VTRYIRRHHIGLIALFVAMTGTAYAGTQVASHRADPQALKAKKKKVKRGPAGPQGPAGPAGQNGQNGSDASIVPPTYQPVAAGNLNCETQPGVFCANPPTGNCVDWQNAGGDSAPAAFAKDAEGFVHLRGAVLGNFSGVGCEGSFPTAIFYLPEGFRPPAAGQYLFKVAITCDGDGQGTISIDSDGAVREASTGCGGLHLDGISFSSGG
jgi:hypothetical protein